MTCNVFGGTLNLAKSNLQHRTRQFTQQNCIHWLGLVSVLQHFHGLGTRYMLTIIYIYFNFTIGQLT